MSAPGEPRAAGSVPPIPLFPAFPAQLAVAPAGEVTGIPRRRGKRSRDQAVWCWGASAGGGGACDVLRSGQMTRSLWAAGRWSVGGRGATQLGGNLRRGCALLWSLPPERDGKGRGRQARGRVRPTSRHVPLLYQRCRHTGWPPVGPGPPSGVCGLMWSQIGKSRAEITRTAAALDLLGI